MIRAMLNSYEDGHHDIRKKRYAAVSQVRLLCIIFARVDGKFLRILPYINVQFKMCAGDVIAAMALLDLANS